jgi:hypothetical protein
VNKCRQNGCMKGVHIPSLPKPILNGIPMAMTCLPDEPFWGKVDDCANFHNYDATDCHSAQNRYDEAHAGVIKHACAAEGIPCDNTSARRVFSHLKREEGEIVQDVPCKCLLEPPREANVYSDGSWLHPVKQFLGLGGAGVWWPRRQILRCDLTGDQYLNPLSEAEMCLAHHCQTPDGLQLYTKIGGFRGSSTRTELAAGIIAMVANGSVHIASDSAAFVLRANVLLGFLADGYIVQPGKPLGLTSDGDLWQHFWECASAKGYASIKNQMG